MDSYEGRIRFRKKKERLMPKKQIKCFKYINRFSKKEVFCPDYDFIFNEGAGFRYLSEDESDPRPKGHRQPVYLHLDLIKDILKYLDRKKYTLKEEQKIIIDLIKEL